jgi:hypothetical protein
MADDSDASTPSARVVSAEIADAFGEMPLAKLSSVDRTVLRLVELGSMGSMGNVDQVSAPAAPLTGAYVVTGPVAVIWRPQDTTLSRYTRWLAKR